MALAAADTVSTENVSRLEPRKLAPFIMNTDARSNSRSSVHRSVELPAKNSPHLSGP